MAVLVVLAVLAAGRVRRAAQAPTSPSASSRPPTARRAGAADDARARCHVSTTSVGGVAPSTAATTRQ